MHEIENENQLVRYLVTKVIAPEDFAWLSLDLKRKLQCVVVVHHLLRRGLAHGIDAVEPAVRVCKKTQIGTGWFLGQKMSQMLALATVGTGIHALSAESQSTETLLRACDRIIETIVPTAAPGAGAEGEAEEFEDHDEYVPVTRIDPSNEIEEFKKRTAIAYEIGFKNAVLEDAAPFEAHVAALRRARTQVEREAGADAAQRFWSGTEDRHTLGIELLPFIASWDAEGDDLDWYLDGFAEYAAWRVFGHDSRLKRNYLMNLLCEGVQGASDAGMDDLVEQAIEARAPCWQIVTLAWGVDPYSILAKDRRNGLTPVDCLYRLNFAGATRKLDAE